ncbi:predicted protein [Uncinocarpus reesii 1704]|uniref:Uncharacterized protein n=1 Tax=Uncinocarpus reesii (strain UAMH 1704) TaxID=336963 RepID=C4JT20_UNCRE|nr:uncharacterized protein UREG_05609 [Uncinocarpus reesii 1704]EEP80767.1 predicted protein [Uncinocarpus reesii 1704]
MEALTSMQAATYLVPVLMKCLSTDHLLQLGGYWQRASFASNTVPMGSIAV